MNWVEWRLESTAGTCSTTSQRCCGLQQQWPVLMAARLVLASSGTPLRPLSGDALPLESCGWAAMAGPSGSRPDSSLCQPDPTLWIVVVITMRYAGVVHSGFNTNSRVAPLQGGGFSLWRLRLAMGWGSVSAGWWSRRCWGKAETPDGSPPAR